MSFLPVILLGLLGSSLAPDDTQTLQALLSEVHQLRVALQTITMTAQRSQILVYRLTAQETAVSRASQALAEAQSGLARLQSAKREAASQAKLEEEWQTHNLDPEMRKRIEVQFAESKRKLENLTADEADLQTRAAEAQSHLREEKDKLAILQAQLDRLDQDLRDAAGAQKP